MIVLSAGMQKSGTGWYFNLTNDLLVAAGHQDVRTVRERFRLHSVLRHHNCNMQQPRLLKFACLMVPHLFGNTFVVKTHGRPSSGSLRFLSSLRIVKGTYIYRDPRDVAISAFEHGQKIRESGQMHAFGTLNSIEASILYVRKLLEIWDEWMQCSQFLIVRYEDLVNDTVNELRRLAGFLSLDIFSEDLHKISVTYQAAHLRENGRIGLHLNRGVIGRFKEVMNKRELDLCNEHFGDYLQRMGYVE